MQTINMAYSSHAKALFDWDQLIYQQLMHQQCNRERYKGRSFTDQISTNDICTTHVESIMMFSMNIVDSMPSDNQYENMVEVKASHLELRFCTTRSTRRSNMLVSILFKVELAAGAQARLVVFRGKHMFHMMMFREVHHANRRCEIISASLQRRSTL
eukprot:5692851-Pleurochrysis_carterae.AAC.2